MIAQTRNRISTVRRELPVDQRTRTMRAVEIIGPRQCRVAVCPYPRIRGNYAVVKVHAAGISDDLPLYKSGSATNSLGFGAAGEVVEVGGSRSLHVGDRVLIPPGYP